jgi:hypothetical protein
MAEHRARRGSIAGAFAWRLIEMLESPAHRALSLSARKILDRLEIELYRHGGKPEENGRLPCTFDHFVEFGVERHAIGPAIRELAALGFVEITRKGCAGNAGYRQSTLYRLTYRHAGSHKHISDEWRRIETLEEAEAIARAARMAKAEGPSKNKSPVREIPTGTSAGNPTNRSRSPVRETPTTGPVRETPTTGPVRETPTTSISREGTPQHRDTLRAPDDDAAAAPSASARQAPAFDLIEDAFRIGDRRIEVRKPAAAASLSVDQLAQHLVASHPSNAYKPVRPCLAVIANPAIATE